MWVNHPLQVSQLGQLSLSSFLGRQMSSKAGITGRVPFLPPNQQRQSTDGNIVNRY